MLKAAVFLSVLLCAGYSAHGADDPKVDYVAVDGMDRRLVRIHFDDPAPDVAAIQRTDFWLVYSKASDKVRKHTVAGVDTSGFSQQNTIVLQLTQAVPPDWDDLDVSLVNERTILHVDSNVVTKRPSGNSNQQGSLEAATKRDDSDIYFSGSYTGVVDGDPVWDIDAFGGYMKAVQTSSHYWGYLGFYGQMKTNSSATADPDSFLTYGVYQRALSKSWLGPFQAPYLNYRFAGWEFDREGKELNFVTSPVLTIPLRLSGKLKGPVEPGLTLPHMTLQLGTEFVDALKTPLAEAKNWHTRGLVGVTFSAGYAPESNGLHSILFTSSYQVRIPSASEIFYDDKFAPVDPTTGKKGDTPQMLGTQARHTVDTTLTYMFLQWAGLSFEHAYGSLPPAFAFTGHSFKVGLTFTLKQTSFGRYSILKP